jgi:hypothetical protein
LAPANQVLAVTWDRGGHFSIIRHTMAVRAAVYSGGHAVRRRRSG